VFNQVVPLIDRLLSENRYGMIRLTDKIVLMQKGVPSEPVALQAWKQLHQEFAPLLQPANPK
jgi:hypothetical protein